MTGKITILDIRRSRLSTDSSLPNLRSLITQGLCEAPNSRSIPSEVLYDMLGLKLYSHGIKNDWPDAGYYPIVAEKEIVKLYSDEISAELTRDKDGRAVIIELGAGSLEKTAEILSAIAKSIPSSTTPLVTYYALDIDRPSVLSSIIELESQIGEQIKDKVSAKGIWGTYEDAFHLLSDTTACTSTLDMSENVPIHILFLGGTIGNFAKFSEDVDFLRSIQLNAERGDRWILGMDRYKDINVLEQAYADHLRPRMMNGLVVAGRVLGDENLFQKGKWKRWSRFNDEKGRIELGYKATTAQILSAPDASLEIDVHQDEVIMVMFSNKYKDHEMSDIFTRANLEVSTKWADRLDKYYLFSLKPFSG